MQRPPSIEALEGAHEFPGRYMFKIFGPGEQAFVDEIRAIAEARLPEPKSPDDLDMSGRLSKQGNYICVTLDMPVESAERVREIYRALRELDGLRMLM